MKYGAQPVYTQNAQFISKTLNKLRRNLFCMQVLQGTLAVRGVQVLSQVTSFVLEYLCTSSQQRFCSHKKWAFLNELERNLLEKSASFFSRKQCFPFPFSKTDGKWFSQYFVLYCPGQDCYYIMCQTGHVVSYT